MTTPPLNCINKGLVTNNWEGGHKTGGGGGHVKFYPYKKVGRKTCVSFEVVLALERWGPNSFHPLKKRGGGQQFYLVLKGGGARKVSDPRFSHFVNPPPRN